MIILRKLFFLGFLLPQLLIAQEVEFSKQSGFYESDFDLELNSNNTSADIRYTLDGNDPTATSPNFNHPFTVRSRIAESNSISNIPTNPPTTSEAYVWMPPQGIVPKARIVKAALFENEIQVSDVFFEEYFIGTPLNEITLPIFSIQIDSTDLFGYEEGLYVPGKDYDDNPNIWQPGNYFERGDAWERTISLTYYEAKNFVFRQNNRLRIHGGGSRLMPSKSLRLYAKKSLGFEFFEYPFFKERPWSQNKRLILRNSGQDFYKSLCHDVIMQDVLKEVNVEYQSSLQIVLFINGVYWGVHNLRERYDKYYFKNFHNLAIDEIDYMEIASDFIAKVGNIDDYENMNEALLELDLSKEEDFQIIADQLDLDNYMDYHISKIYSGINDWIGNNERVWRTQEEGSKWRWVGNDYDDAFREVEKNSYEHATRTEWVGWPTPEWSTRLFRSLMMNEAFASKYKNKLIFHLENTYDPASMISRIDSVAALYKPEMARQIARWNYPRSIESWETTINEMKSFALRRPSFVLENFETFFPNIYLNPDEVSIYPNPVNQEFYIDLPEDSGSAVHFSIYNSSGQKMMDGKLTDSYRNIINSSSFDNGFYIIKIENDVFSKIIVAR